MGFSGIGLQPLPDLNTGRPVRVSNDGAPEWLAIGVTPGWDLITALTADYTEPIAGTFIKAGDKYTRFGTIWTRITSGTYRGIYIPFSSNAVLLANPTTAPVLTDGGVGVLAAGDYKVGYTDLNAYGETMLSTTATITLGATKKIHIAALALPSGATSRKWYVSKAANSTDVAYAVTTTDGAAFDINAVGTTPEEPSANTTYYPGANALVQGECGIQDRTLVASNKDSTMHLGLIEGGGIYRERLLVDSGGQPSLSQVLTAMPRLRPGRIQY